MSTGEFGIIMRPKVRPASSVRGIIYCHGAGDTGTTWQSVQQRMEYMLPLVAAGHVVLSCDLGGTETWANDTFLSRMDAAAAYLQGLSGVKNDGVVIVGQSMGGLGALAWARSNRASTKCVIGIIPVVNLTDCHDNRGYGSVIDTAYGGTYTEGSDGAAHNPYTMATAGHFTNLPVQIWYGSTDTTCPPDITAAFGGLIGSSATLIEVTGGHSDDTVAEVDTTSVLAFIAASESVMPVLP